MRYFAILVVVLMLTARAEAGLVQTLTETLDAVPGMTIPNAATLDEHGGCVYNVVSTDGVEVTYWFDAPTCTATVETPGTPTMRAADGGAYQLPPLGEAFKPIDPSQPMPPKAKKKGNTKKMDPSVLVTPAEPLSSAAPDGARVSISCPRTEFAMRERARLAFWYPPHQHYHRMLQADARSKFWYQQRNGAVGEVHPYNYPFDWASWSIGPEAFAWGWRWWYFSDIAVGNNGPYNVSGRATVVFRNAGYFTTNTAALNATAASDQYINRTGYCSAGGLALDPAHAPYRVYCWAYAYFMRDEPCYY